WAGMRVVVTGGPAERGLTARAAGGVATDLGGRTTLPMLAAVLAGAAVAVVPNTGAAHLAAGAGGAVGSPFAPGVPWPRWRPYGVPAAALGDPAAPCAGSRARACPVPGHPCLGGIDPEEVRSAVADLGGPALAAPVPAGPAPAGTELA